MPRSGKHSNACSGGWSTQLRQLGLMLYKNFLVLVCLIPWNASLDILLAIVNGFFSCFSSIKIYTNVTIFCIVKTMAFQYSSLDMANRYQRHHLGHLFCWSSTSGLQRY
jgi:hypothetical protein